MASNSRGRRLPAILAAAILLAVSPVVAWSQSADTWRQKLQGTWCDAEHGCTHWWTLYRVLVGSDDSIVITYRERPFLIFHGKIQEPVGRWTIKAKITGGKHDGQEFEAAASSLEHLKEIVQGKFKGSLKAKIQAAEIEGIRVQETSGITISGARIDEPKIDEPKIDEPKIDEPKIDEPKIHKPNDPKIDGVKIGGDVTLEKAKIKEPETEGATTKAKEITAESLRAGRMEAKKLEAKELEGKKMTTRKIVGRKIEGGNQVEISIPIQISEATIEGIAKPKRGKGKKEDEAEDDEGGQKRNRIVVEGTVKGKIAGSAGSVDLSGDFEGTFTALVQAIVKGSYAVPPRACSEAGSPLSEEEKADLKIRRRVKSWAVGGEALNRNGGVPEDRPGRYLSEKEEEDTRKFKLRFAPFAATQGFVDAAKKTQIFVDAMPTKAPRPAEPHTQGKFMRKVGGAVNALEPATITLDLPPLPVLDHKCSVIDELPKRTLKLVKQHDATR